MSNNTENTPNEIEPYEVSYGSQITDTAMRRTPLSEILDTIRTGSSGIAELIHQIRAENDADARRELKIQLPYFLMGEFQNNRRENKAFVQTQFLILDFDHIGMANELKAFRSQLSEDSQVLAHFVSPSGDGVKVIVRLDRALTSTEQYRRTYDEISRTFHQRHGKACDNRNDPARACFISHDPELHYNREATPFSNCPEETQTAVSNGLAQDAILTLLDQGATVGNRHTALTKLVGLQIDRGFDIHYALKFAHLWNTRNEKPLPEDEIGTTVEHMYQHYSDKHNHIPVRITERGSIYYKEDKNVALTSFVLRPKELLVLSDSDCLRCDVVTKEGFEFEDIMIENTDWHTKQKFLKALSHQECSFYGSEQELQSLASHVIADVRVRKKGTKVTGLDVDENLWAAKGINITRSGILDEPKVIPYAKGTESFHHGIAYELLPDAEYREFLGTFFGTIASVNRAEVMLPMLGWFMACPLKERIMPELGGFPLLFVHGAQGSGKTSTSQLLKRLAGYADPSPVSCTQKAFPMLKLVSSTNGVPVILDEFKKSDMPADSYEQLLRLMRKSYSGEAESKGRADQTTVQYNLSAPLCVMGEWNIVQPAILERVLVARFANTVKTDQSMQSAFTRLWAMPLEGFMPRYIQFCLDQDVRVRLTNARKVVAETIGDMTVAPRIANNLTVMAFGLQLLESFGKEFQCSMANYDIGSIIKSQIMEITGSDNKGFVRSAVDQLIESLSTWAMQEKPSSSMTGRDMNGFNCKFRENSDWKLIQTDAGRAIAINFKKIYPEYREYVRRTAFDGEVLDAKSYMKLFDDTEYVYKKDHPVRYELKSIRSLVIVIDKALAAGIDLEGFGIESE